MIAVRNLLALGLVACLSTPYLAAQKKETRAEKKAEAAIPSYYGPQPESEAIDLTVYARIREEGLKHSHVMEFGAALADGIGPRLMGSPNMAKANAWALIDDDRLGWHDRMSRMYQRAY